MGGANKSVIIEISEDAYKQNSVYRPWDELQLATTRTAQSIQAPSPQSQQPHSGFRPKPAAIVSSH